MSSGNNYIVHTLLHAHNEGADAAFVRWSAGVCALVGMGGAGKTAIAERRQGNRTRPREWKRSVSGKPSEIEARANRSWSAFA